MGYRHTREQLLDGAVEAVLDEGLTRLTFGRLASRLGVTDRAIVYYFPTKDDLVGAVLLAVSGRLTSLLEEAASAQVTDHRGLVGALWPALARPAVDPYFAVFFEATGLAASGAEPYRTLAGSLVTAWIDWLAPLVLGPAAVRRREAQAAVALLDGLLLMRQLAGPAVANRAAQVLLESRPTER